MTQIVHQATVFPSITRIFIRPVMLCFDIDHQYLLESNAAVFVRTLR